MKTAERVTFFTTSIPEMTVDRPVLIQATLESRGSATLHFPGIDIRVRGVHKLCADPEVYGVGQ